MIIEKTCPICGRPVIESVICTYPPIPTARCNHCNWYWEGQPEKITRVPFNPDGVTEEYIVAYSNRCCTAELTSDFVFYEDYNHSLKGQYEQAICRRQGSKYGDLVSWNNRWWASVMATSSNDAINKVVARIFEDPKKDD